MDYLAMLKTSNALWTKYSAYQKVENGDDVIIVPTANAKQISYNIADYYEKLVVDALEIGLYAISEGYEARTLDLIYAFIKKYGLLNLADNEEITKDYSESVSDLSDFFKNLYMHFTASYYYNKTEESQMKDIYESKISSLGASGISLSLDVLDTPILVWDIVSLYDFLVFVYSLYITNTEEPLRICKHCGMPFVAKNSKNEFCSPQCRNQFNVYKSRAKNDK